MTQGCNCSRKREAVNGRRLGLPPPFPLPQDFLRDAWDGNTQRGRGCANPMCVLMLRGVARKARSCGVCSVCLCVCVCARVCVHACMRGLSGEGCVYACVFLYTYSQVMHVICLAEANTMDSLTAPIIATDRSRYDAMGLFTAPIASMCHMLSSPAVEQ